MPQPPRRPTADRNAPDNDELAPEARNRSQDDEGEQAQTLGDEALGRGPDFDAGESEKPEYDSISDSDGDSTPDLVDTMNQMVSSGRIDNGAFAGEPMHDDEEDRLGQTDSDDDA